MSSGYWTNRQQSHQAGIRRPFMYSRRCLLGLFSALYASTSIPRLVRATTSAERTSQNVEEISRPFRLEAPLHYVELLKEELHFDGEPSKDPNAKSGAAVLILAGLALLPYLANAILALRRNFLSGGVVVDARGETIEVSPDTQIPAKMVIIVTPHGTEIYESNEIVDPTDIIAALLKQ